MNAASVFTPDCIMCCRPSRHRGDHCVLCLERRDDKDRRCRSKNAYAYRSDADSAASRFLGLAVYRCRYGPHWHVGHELGAKLLTGVAS